MYGDIHVHVREGNVILNYNNYKFCVQILFLGHKSEVSLIVKSSLKSNHKIVH